MAGTIAELTDANWESEVLDSTIPVLAEFWAPWCGPCRMLAPTIEKLAGDYEGKVKIGKMNTDENEETPGGLRISAIPTVLIFQGGMEVDRLVGVNTESKFHKSLSKLGIVGKSDIGKKGRKKPDKTVVPGEKGLTESEWKAVIKEVEADTTVESPTELEALIQSRIGQGQFRDKLMIVWKARCAVTGHDLPTLLRASHIKPWKVCNNQERLDPNNGLLLSPAYEVAFDRGLLTFEDDGGMILSKELTPDRVQTLGIKPDARIDELKPGNKVYLAHHRLNVFRG